MSKFLKGNYRRPKGRDRLTAKKPPPKDLTQEFEEHVLAKLGGSLCFVMKRGTFIWSDSAATPDRKPALDDAAGPHPH